MSSEQPGSETGKSAGWPRQFRIVHLLYATAMVGASMAMFVVLALLPLPVIWRKMSASPRRVRE